MTNSDAQGIPAGRLPVVANGHEVGHHRVVWAIVIAALILQYALFRQYVIRDIAWGWPLFADQGQYLMSGYTTYQTVVDDGLPSGIWRGLTMRYPQSLTMPVQAAGAFVLLGPNRLAALTLNFAYFAVFQITLVAVLLWLTRRGSAALIGLGLLLTTATPFMWAGGLSDFRTDFMALCLFGTFIALVLRSELFFRWRWSLAAGAVALWLTLMRYIVLAYFIPILGTMFVLFLAIAWKSRANPRRRQDAIRRASGVMLTSLLISLSIIAILFSFDSIQRYYGWGHALGPEKHWRAAELNLSGLWDHIQYYPVSVWKDHLGPAFLILSAALLLASLVKRVLHVTPPTPPGAAGLHGTSWDSPTQPGTAGRQGIFIGLCLLFPYLVLTSDMAKSPVVGDILVPGVVWCITLWIVWLAGIDRRRAGAMQRPWIRRGMAGIALLTGMALTANRQTTPSPLRKSADDGRAVMRMYDDLIGYTRKMNWTAPRVSIDTNAHFFSAMLLNLVAFERDGRMLHATAALGQTLAQIPPDEVFARLRNSDLALLTKENRAPVPPFPFDQEMAQLRPRLLESAYQGFEPIGEYSYYGRDMILFARAAPVATPMEVRGESGGWITRDGLTITIDSDALRQHESIVLRGAFNPEWLPRTPKPAATIAAGGDPTPVQLPATIEADGGQYTVRIELIPQAIPASGPAKIRLTFDAFFVPRELGIGPDDRELVLKMPSEITAYKRRRPAATSP